MKTNRANLVEDPMSTKSFHTSASPDDKLLDRLPYEAPQLMDVVSLKDVVLQQFPTPPPPPGGSGSPWDEDRHGDDWEDPYTGGGW